MLIQKVIKGQEQGVEIMSMVKRAEKGVLTWCEYMERMFEEWLPKKDMSEVDGTRRMRRQDE